MDVNNSPRMSSYAQLSHIHQCTTDTSNYAAVQIQRGKVELGKVFGSIDVCILLVCTISHTVFFIKRVIHTIFKCLDWCRFLFLI